MKRALVRFRGAREKGTPSLYLYSSYLVCVCVFSGFLFVCSFRCFLVKSRYGLFASERFGRLGVSHELSCVFVLTEKNSR